jgi:hypothetical protein
MCPFIIIHNKKPTNEQHQIAINKVKQLYKTVPNSDRILKIT